VPFHSAPKEIELYGKKYNQSSDYGGLCPDRLLHLPRYYDLPIEQIGDIIQYVYDFLMFFNKVFI